MPEPPLLIYEIFIYSLSFQLVPSMCLLLVSINRPHGQMFSINEVDSCSVLPFTPLSLPHLAALYTIDFAAPHEKKKANIYPRTFFAPKHFASHFYKYRECSKMRVFVILHKVRNHNDLPKAIQMVSRPRSHMPHGRYLNLGNCTHSLSCFNVPCMCQ